MQGRGRGEFPLPDRGEEGGGVQAEGGQGGAGRRGRNGRASLPAVGNHHRSHGLKFLN